MPYNCEECGNLGARMNVLFKIRLCVNCTKSFKYKVITKSKAFNEFKLQQADLDNYSNNNPNEIKEYIVANPHYKSGPPMRLYLQSDITKVFLSKYNDLIINTPNTQNIPNLLDNLDNLDNLNNLNNYKKITKMAKIVHDYCDKQKALKKQEKYYKILDKYHIESEEELPVWVQNKLIEVDSVAKYNHVITSYIRFEKLHKLLKQEKLIKYIDHKLSHDYIYQTNKSIKLEQIPNIIRFMLNKKKLVSRAIKEHKINSSKYSKEISTYINSFEMDNDLDKLIENIKIKEENNI